MSAGLSLDELDLHESLGDPVLRSIGFLNEVMGRYPEATSFAPGAPNPAFVDTFDHEPYVRTFLDHVRRRGSLSDTEARRLLFEYGPSRGLINDIIATAFATDHDVDCSPRAIVVTVGAQEAMFLALRALTKANDLLAVANPCFPGIVGAARLLDVSTVPVQDTAAGLDLEQLRATCVAARAHGNRLRACYVAPDYANPGGGRMSLADRRNLLALAEEEDFLLLEDNAYGFIADTEDELPPLKAIDHSHRVVHIGTFAKIGVPGTRVGFAIADQPVHGRGVLADELADLKSMVTVNTSPLCQAVVGGLILSHGGSLRRLGQVKGALYRRNLELLLDALDRHLTPAPTGVTWERPRGGFFVRVWLPVPADTALLEISAARYGVLWTPMSNFYLDQSGDNVLRLSCSYLDPGSIDAGITRFATFLREQAAEH